MTDLLKNNGLRTPIGATLGVKLCVCTCGNIAAASVYRARLLKTRVLVLSDALDVIQHCHQHLLGTINLGHRGVYSPGIIVPGFLTWFLVSTRGFVQGVIQHRSHAL